MLDSLLPTSGSQWGGTEVTLTGTDFVAGATVTFGGTPATLVTFNDPTSLTATTPVHAVGTVAVTVTNPDAQNSTLNAAFNFFPDLPFLDGFESGDSSRWSASRPEGSFRALVSSAGTESARGESQRALGTVKPVVVALVAPPSLSNTAQPSW